MKINKGITLIALVITIIVLLILSGVSVAMLTGKNGLFEKARLARENTEKAEYKEIIKMAQAEDNITTDRLRGKETKLNGIAEILNKDKKLGEGTGTQINKEYQDKENPRLVVKTKEGWVYIVTVDGIKELGKVDGDIPLDIDVKNGDIKYIYEPNYWTNSDVEVSLSIAKEEYKEFKIQYSYDLKTWKDYTEKIVVENNKAIYSRITTGTSVSESYATGNVINIDKKEAEISTAMNSSNVTTKGFTVNVGVTDENSGLGKIVWYYKKSDATSYTSEEVIYKDLHSVQAGETTAVTKSKTYDNLTSGTYNVYAEIYDVAGNITRANSSDKPLEITLGTVAGLTDANTKFKANPTGWTNGKVTMTASTNVSGYTIQTSKDAQTWSSTASQEFTENGKIYARLWDGTNAGGYSTGNVTNIDTLAPKDFTPTATSTTKSITVTANTTDADATETSGNSGIDGYRFKLDSGSWTGYQTSGEYTWNNLTQTTNHTITVEAKDNAGNTKQGTVSKGTGTVETAGTASYTPTGWTSGNVTVTLPTMSGYSTRYTTNGTMPTTNSTEYNGALTITGNCTIYYVYTDGTNIGGVGTLSITNIDKTPPGGVTVTYNGGANSCSWKNNYNLTLSASDSQSGVAYYEIDWDGDGNSNRTTNSNFIPWDGYSSCNTRFRAVDNLGNRGAWTGANHIHMDTTKPSMSVELYTTSKGYYPKVSLSDSNLNTLQIKGNGLNYSNSFNSTSYNESIKNVELGNGTYTFIVIDKAGNSTSKVVRIQMILTQNNYGGWNSNYYYSSYGNIPDHSYGTKDGFLLWGVGSSHSGFGALATYYKNNINTTNYDTITAAYYVGEGTSSGISFGIQLNGTALGSFDSATSKNSGNLICMYRDISNYNSNYTVVLRASGGTSDTLQSYIMCSGMYSIRDN